MLPTRKNSSRGSTAKPQSFQLKIDEETTGKNSTKKFQKKKKTMEALPLEGGTKKSAPRRRYPYTTKPQKFHPQQKEKEKKRERRKQ